VARRAVSHALEATVTARLARVEVPVGGRVHEVAGPRAELVALVAAADLSARTVRLLLAIALEEDRLILIDHGSVTVDLSPVGLRLTLQQTRPRVALDERTT
jgi:uncharacterized hydantoinase/oxoprolinase family protein